MKTTTERPAQPAGEACVQTSATILIMSPSEPRRLRESALAGQGTVVKLPYSACRRLHSRKPRRSKNGTPEEREKLREAGATGEERRIGLSIVGGVDRFLDSQPQAEPSTETAKSLRLRQDRRKAWRLAERAVAYWKARRDLHHAISCAQMAGIPEGELHPASDHREDWDLVAKWRAALAHQLLAPAPDALAVKWKQAALARDVHHYTGVDASEVERAIADDLAFLAANPVRRSNRKTGGES